MPDQSEYTYEAYTTRPFYEIGLNLFLVAIGLYFAWRAYTGFLPGLHSSDHAERLNAWVSLLLLIAWLPAIGLRLLVPRRKQVRPAARVVVGDEEIVVTDDEGKTTVFPWYALDDVLVFPRSKRDTGMAFLLGGDRSAFVPERIRDPDDLLAEILRRSRLELRQEEPNFRRYSRTVRSA